MIGKIFTIAFQSIVAVILLLAAPGVFHAFGTQLGTLGWHRQAQIMIAGTLLGVWLIHFFWKKFPRLFVFEHEFTHLLAGLVVGLRPLKFVVQPHGGYVVYTPFPLMGIFAPFSFMFAGLAPYVLPTFTILAVLARGAVPPTALAGYDFFIGVTFGMHTWSTVLEGVEQFTDQHFIHFDLGQVQTDLGERGLLFSSLYILVVSIAVHGMLLAVLVGGPDGLQAWTQEVVTVTQAAVD